jgi:hypothetical protein
MPCFVVMLNMRPKYTYYLPKEQSQTRIRLIAVSIQSRGYSVRSHPVMDLKWYSPKVALALHHLSEMSD